MREIAERVLARAAANRAYAEQQYGPQAGEPDEVALARYALEAEKTATDLCDAIERDAARRAYHADMGAGEWEAFVPEQVWDALQKLLDFLAEREPAAQPTERNQT